MGFISGLFPCRMVAFKWSDGKQHSWVSGGTGQEECEGRAAFSSLFVRHMKRNMCVLGFGQEMVNSA